MDTQMDILVRVLCFSFRAFTCIVPGLLIANLLLRAGALQKLVAPAGRLFTWLTNLPPEAGVAFLSGFGSGYTGGSMLVDFHSKGIMNDREILLSAVTLSVPVFVREVFSYYLPIAYPVMGLVLGSIYLGLRFLDVAVKVIVVCLLGKLTLRVSKESRSVQTGGRTEKTTEKTKDKGNWVTMARESLSGCWKPLRRMAMTIPAAALIVYELQALGVFDSLPVSVKGLGLPPCSTASIVAYLAQPVMGVSALAASYQSRELTLLEATRTMLWAMLLASPVRLLRYSVSHYVGVYGFSLGIKISLLNFCINGIVYTACLLIVTSIR